MGAQSKRSLSANFRHGMMLDTEARVRALIAICS